MRDRSQNGQHTGRDHNDYGNTYSRSENDRYKSGSRPRGRSPDVTTHRRESRRDGRDRQSRRSRPPETGNRKTKLASAFPPRPTAHDVDDDKSIHANSYSESRRLKRLKLAEDGKWLIWGRSPSPVDEPLLRDEPDSQQQQASEAGPDEPGRNPEEDELDQEELRIFVKWLEQRKAEIKEHEERRRKEEEDSRPVGPVLPATTHVDAPGEYGINLRPGEGERMAEFARQGQRIPRRGEVGLTSDQIESFEHIGYVMSGSRHSRMNAIRIRKENQVYTAEEKAALAMFNQEEAKRKEQQLTDQFRQLIQETIGEAEAGTSAGGEAAGGCGMDGTAGAG